MFCVREPEIIHEIDYRSSGTSNPRDLTVQISKVLYEPQVHSSPTFLATADLQGRETTDANRLLGERVADEVLILQELGDLPALDLCLLCGDFYDYPDLRKLGGTGDVTPAFNALSKTAKETFAVLGNHDEVTIDELLPSIRLLDGDTVKTDWLTVSGVSGIVGDPKRNNRKTEAEFLAAIDHCSTARTDLLLLHQGPQGNGPGARGLDVVNQRLRRRSNLLVLFGHCHWNEPFHVEGRNVFCNVDARVLVFIPA